jgi:hypothetical protein
MEFHVPSTSSMYGKRMACPLFRVQQATKMAAILPSRRSRGPVCLSTFQSPVLTMQVGRPHARRARRSRSSRVTGNQGRKWRRGDPATATASDDDLEPVKSRARPRRRASPRPNRSVSLVTRSSAWHRPPAETTTITTRRPTGGCKR